MGAFTKADEEAFETFAIYCGLALHHAKVRQLCVSLPLNALCFTSQPHRSITTTPEKHLQNTSIPIFLHLVIEYLFMVNVKTIIDRLFSWKLYIVLMTCQVVEMEVLIYDQNGFCF